ncbi:hypothetical protein F5B19DRAFT_456062, partial [Rostrohypoxylon terebratum]
MVSERLDLSSPLQKAPLKPQMTLSCADVAVTATANGFDGIYQNKKYRYADFENTLDRALVAGGEKVMLAGTSLSDTSINLTMAQSRL